MPSPFPGMDPYIESPYDWRNFHHTFIDEAMRRLNADLPRGYVATIDERLYVIPPQRSIYPDLALIHRSEGAGRARTTAQTQCSDDSTIVLTVYPEQIREGFIEVRTKAPERRLVTVVELLSPTNKVEGSRGWDEYHEKQDRLIHSDVNLLEIDLLRGGKHAVAAPEWRLLDFGQWDYLTCLHRPHDRYTFECKLLSLRRHLPAVSVPLLEPDMDAELDLQTVFDTTYAVGRFAELVDYTAEITPPLNAEDREWADALLREKGLRA